MYYQVQPSHGFYGARIWVSWSSITPEVREGLNAHSKWGGADKRDQTGQSWEFGEDQLWEACSFLNCIGR